MKKCGGYGSSMRWIPNLVNNTPVPAAFIAHRRRVVGAIYIAALFSIVLPLVTSGLTHFTSLETTVESIETIIPWLRSLCASRGFKPVFEIWYLYACLATVVIGIFAVVDFPRETLIVLAGRISNAGAHAAAFLACLLVLALLILTLSTEGGLCPPTPPRGHADVINQLMTSSAIGLSVAGTLLWVVLLATGMSTMHLGVGLATRCVLKWKS